MGSAPALMLAQRGSVESIDFLQKRGFEFDLKVDGIRCLASIGPGSVHMSSRGGEVINEKFPEIRDALHERFPGRLWTLDGEIAVPDERGLPSWPLTHRRAAQSGRRSAEAAAANPARFYIFDVLEADTRGLHHVPYVERRAILEDVVPMTATDTLQPVLHSPDGHAMWQLVAEHRLEGMIAKRSDSLYRAGRSADWLKIKRTNTASFLVGGFDPGTGSRKATFGALHLYLLNDEEELVPVGKVGSGFSDKELVAVTAALAEPPLVVEVEFLDVSPDGQLRQPVFHRVRVDQRPQDCTLDQIKEAR